MRIVVVGGGTAGWISALLVQSLVPGAQVTLVASKEIGILGAGEGTTPHFVELFLKPVGIPVEDVVRHAGATFKNSIVFVNWRGDGRSYVHPFNDDVTPFPNLAMIHPENPLPNKKVSFSGHLSERGRVLLSEEESPDGSPAGPGGLRNLGRWALHFDAVRLAAFLERVGRGRGIGLVEGTVTRVRSSHDGAVASLGLVDGREVDGDLYLDCTGFKRLLISGHYGVPWVDVHRALPLDRALPFSLPLDGPRPPYTEAIAMDAGWVWKIPVEGRFGCGYVFDSEFASEEEARAQVRARFGADIEFPRLLGFKAGYLERIWVKNCLAVGLSSAFLEPLEATSIMVTLATLHEFIRVHLAQNDEIAREELNGFHRRMHEHIVDFLHAHYLGGRADTPFWKTFPQRTEAPPMSRRILERAGYRWPLEPDPMNGSHPAPFPVESWIWVSKGLGLLERASVERYWRYFGLHQGAEQRIKEHVGGLRRMSRACLRHEDALQRLGSG